MFEIIGGLILAGVILFCTHHVIKWLYDWIFDSKF
jgi:hypothetical protein